MEQEKMPIIDALIKHQQKRPVSFHVPGHKFGTVIGEIPDDFRTILSYDATEITGLDDFHSPEGAILEAQTLLTKLYGSKKSYFLVNGSTAGNLAMIASSFQKEDIVLVQRNCHKSIIHGLMLANIRPVFLEPEYDEKTKSPAGVSLDTLKLALERFPNAKGLILIYPSYYGVSYPIKELIDYAHQKDCIVLVDEAHGPHLVLGDPFPPSALSMGADMVVQSAHKMLPAMTMGSFFHVGTERPSLEKVEFYLSLFQSSSPSYPIMASLDAARQYLALIKEEDVAFTLEERERFVEWLQKEKDLQVAVSEFPYDPLKLIVRSPNSDGFQLKKDIETAGVFPELADPYQILFTLPLLKEGNRIFYQQAKEAIARVTITERNVRPVELPALSHSKVSSVPVSFENWKEKDKRWVKLSEAEGSISAAMIIPYPPGIPLLMMGERVTKEKIDFIEELVARGAHIQGDHQLNEGFIAVY
ncbi:aminotransferase class I/II-fold pyridoxal phosphate-dependent enzyme [Bacillus smithii]|uniref:aminotransferase class I/II-fold pyridoxal phosphate-dependent enzyme n=1 Tax=Bacillus smithii TaxID=1479 RepID=UPI002E241EB1|nr:aminotransferase class I/II-fold pyridoxal phosphate-dependent enzyme [Bacillus smithii]